MFQRRREKNTQRHECVNEQYKRGYLSVCNVMAQEDLELAQDFKLVITIEKEGKEIRRLYQSGLESVASMC